MSDATAEPVEVPKKTSKMPLVLGLVGALVGGGAGFYASFSGMILSPADPPSSQDKEPPIGPAPDVAFVEFDPIVVTLGSPADGRHLQFRAQLEVPSQYEADVRKLLPRVIDVLNGYLRAVRPSDLESSAALSRLRSQMLRRVHIVLGEERVNDLLIMEFVVN